MKNRSDYSKWGFLRYLKFDNPSYNLSYRKEYSTGGLATGPEVPDTKEDPADRVNPFTGSPYSDQMARLGLQDGGEPFIMYNNPGNIEVGQGFAGETGKTYANNRERPFVIFDSPEAGLRALMRDLRTKVKNSNGDLKTIMNKYAPPSDNNPTSSYINYIKQNLDNRNKVTLEDVPTIAKSIIMFENKPNANMTENQKQNAQKRIDIYFNPDIFNDAVKFSTKSFPAGTSTDEMKKSFEEE